MQHTKKIQDCAVLAMLLVATSCLAGVSQAADPQISAIAPYGLQQGTEVTVTFFGTRLTDVEALLLYRPGIAVKQVKAVDEKKVEVTLAIAKDCPLGLHAVRLRAATGISNLYTFSVGALPVVAEKEPNSDFANPQVIDFNSTVSGVVQNEDVDYFAIEAKKGDRICVELEGVRLGNPTFFDPFVAILNTDRFELARCDDVALLRQDALCALLAPRDGRYIVAVRESAYGGNGNCKYLVHIGSFPRPTAVLPAGGRSGEQLSVKWIGDAAGQWTSTVTLPTDAGAEHDLFARDKQGVAPSPNRVRVGTLGNVMEKEPNDDLKQATPTDIPAAVNGVIEHPGDTDYFKFHAKKGEVLDVRVYARRVLRSPLDSVLTITRVNGAAVGSNDDDNSQPDSYLRFNAPADDDYYVAMRDQLSSGGPDYVYRIELAPPAAELTLTLPERIQYVPMTVSVPRGNRFAVMVNAARANFGGDLQIAAEGLPQGLSTPAVKMAGNSSSVPMLFEAASDAPLAGALVDLVGRPVDAKLPVVGHLSQRTMLVRGQNNRDVWGHDADRMAVAATAPAPFSIQIVQPKVPIVRRGSMQLKVVAERKEGFKSPISVFMLYNPPGIGSSGSITIPADKNEAMIPLTANENAPLSSYPIIVVSRSSVAGGNLETASQLAQLEVADTFFNLTFEKTAVELGQKVDVIVRIETKREFSGKATLQLLGLPAKTQVDPKPIEFAKDTTELVFPIQVDAAARPGKYQTLVCRAIVTQDGAPIVQTLGSGELRIDKPLPPKVTAKPVTPAATKPAATKPADEKPVKQRLSRLEQLRLQRQQNKGEKE